VFMFRLKREILLNKFIYYMIIKEVKRHEWKKNKQM